MVHKYKEKGGWQHADEDKVKDAIFKINAGSIRIRKSARVQKVSEEMICYGMKSITQGRPIQQHEGPQCLAPQRARGSLH